MSSRKENCLLCFNELTEKASNFNSKLYNLCCTYLHSAIIKEPFKDESSVNNSFPLCSNCIESAMKLIHLSEQMKLFKKSIADLVFLFSLEILHRRGKSDNNGGVNRGNNSESKYLEIDIRSLTNGDSYPSSSLSGTSESLEEHSQQTTAEISQISDDSFPAGNSNGNEEIIEVDFEKIKCENLYTHDCIDEINLPFESDNIELSTPSAEGENCSIATLEGQSPTLQLQRLQFDGNGEIVTTERIALNGDNSHQKSHITIKTVWSQSLSGPGTCYKLKKHTETVSANESNRDEESPMASSSAIATSNEQTQEETADVELLNSNVGFTRVLRSYHRRLKDHPSFVDISKMKQYQYDVRPSKKGSLNSTVADNKRPYKCDFCNCGFEKESNMLSHRERHHIGERPFKCQRCPQAFMKESSLSYHHQVEHQNIKEKPFICGVCDKGFLRRGSLMSHIGIHTGETPHRCNQCEFATCFPHILTLHKRKAHNPSVCNLRSKKKPGKNS